MSTQQTCLRGGEAAFTGSRRDNGLTATNDQPAKLLSKTKSYFTTKSISVASFVAAYATVLSFENYGIWAAMPPAFGLMTVLFWSVA